MQTNTKVSTPKVSPLVTALGLTASKKAIKKPSVAVVALNSDDTMKLVSTYANAQIRGLESISTMALTVQTFIDHKVKFVKLTATKLKDTLEYKYTAQTKDQFTNAFLALKSKDSTPEDLEKFKGTIAQYWKTFFNAVNDKIIPTGLDPARNKKASNNLVVKKAKVEKSIVTYFNSIIDHSGFKKLPEELQFEIRDYLASEGEVKPKATLKPRAKAK